MDKSGGIGLCGVLTIIFVVLKLLHVINWSWIWVFSPVWIPMIFWLLIFAVAFIAHK